MEEIDLREFSLDTNNLPNSNLRNRISRWRIWRSRNPYERILDRETERLINEREWTEDSYQNYGEEINQEETDFGDDVSIDIPEETPLLDNVGGIATAGGSAIGGGLITPGVAAAGIGLAGAGVLAGGLYGIIKRGQEGEGYVLPDSEYIGPGNPVPVSAAKNSADQVAKEHDIKYGEISQDKTLTEEQFNQEVINADTDAISNFQKSYNEDGHINAKIGEYGLRTKQLVEQIIGRPLYPKSKYLVSHCPLFLFQNAKSFGTSSL